MLLAVCLANSIIFPKSTSTKTHCLVSSVMFSNQAMLAYVSSVAPLCMTFNQDGLPTELPRPQQCLTCSILDLFRCLVTHLLPCFLVDAELHLAVGALTKFSTDFKPVRKPRKSLLKLGVTLVSIDIVQTMLAYFYQIVSLPILIWTRKLRHLPFYHFKL